MEKAIKTRLSALANDGDANSVDKEKVTELILDGSKFKSITVEEGQLLQEFKNLTKISLNGTGVSNLDNFPEISTLQVLELTDNYLSDPLIFTLLPRLFPNLKTLQLGGNYFKSLDDIKPLASLKKLTVLGLALNPLAKAPDYRDQVFASLPNLQVLDHNDRSGAERLLESDSENDDEEYSDEDDDLLKKFYDAEYKTDDEDDEFVPQDQASPDEDIPSEDSFDDAEGDDDALKSVNEKRLLGFEKNDDEDSEAKKAKS